MPPKTRVYTAQLTHRTAHSHTHTLAHGRTRTHAQTQHSALTHTHTTHTHTHTTHSTSHSSPLLACKVHLVNIPKSRSIIKIDCKNNESRRSRATRRFVALT